MRSSAGEAARRSAPQLGQSVIELLQALVVPARVLAQTGKLLLGHQGAQTADHTRPTHDTGNLQRGFPIDRGLTRGTRRIRIGPQQRLGCRPAVIGNGPGQWRHAEHVRRIHVLMIAPDENVDIIDRTAASSSPQPVGHARRPKLRKAERQFYPARRRIREVRLGPCLFDAAANIGIGISYIGKDSRIIAAPEIRDLIIGAPTHRCSLVGHIGDGTHHPRLQATQNPAFRAV